MLQRAGQHDDLAGHGNQFADATAAAAKSQPNSPLKDLFEARCRHHAMAEQSARRTADRAIAFPGTKCRSHIYQSIIDAAASQELAAETARSSARPCIVRPLTVS
jgi:hypothetical protein